MSSALPCGRPSATSTSTTSATPRVASRNAAVAPTCPAPTTVTFGYATGPPRACDVGAPRVPATGAVRAAHGIVACGPAPTARASRREAQADAASRWSPDTPVGPSCHGARRGAARGPGASTGRGAPRVGQRHRDGDVGQEQVLAFPRLGEDLAEMHDGAARRRTERRAPRRRGTRSARGRPATGSASSASSRTASACSGRLRVQLPDERLEPEGLDRRGRASGRCTRRRRARSVRPSSWARRPRACRRGCAPAHGATTLTCGARSATFCDEGRHAPARVAEAGHARADDHARALVGGLLRQSESSAARSMRSCVADPVLDDGDLHRSSFALARVAPSTFRRAFSRAALRRRLCAAPWPRCGRAFAGAVRARRLRGALGVDADLPRALLACAR